MDSVYNLAVRLSFSTGGVASAVGGVIGLFGRLQAQARSMQGQMAGMPAAIAQSITQYGFMSKQHQALLGQQGQLPAQSQAINRGLGQMAGGLILTGIGVVGIKAITGWATAAGQMQDALVQVGMAAGGTRQQLQDLFTQSFGVANRTQYSGSDVLSMEQIMGRMGFRDLSGHMTQRQVIGASIEQFARAAEIVQHFTGAGSQETVTALAQQAHMFGAYSGQALQQNVAWATGATLLSHMTPSQEVNVLRYMAPAVKSGQISSLDALSLAALGNQTGLTVGGRAASSIGTLLRELSPNGSAKQDDALGAIERLGGGNFYQGGKLIKPEAWLGILNRFYNATKGDQPLQTYLAKNGLLVQGQQAAAVLGSNTSIQQYAAIHAQLTKDTPAWATSTQGQLNATLPGQMQTLQGNLGSIRDLLGTQLLPLLTPIVHGFVLMTGALVSLLAHHPEIARFVAVFALLASVAAVIIGPILAVGGAMAVMSTAGITLSAVGVALSAAFLPVTLTVLGIAAAVAAVIFVWDHWSQITGAFSTVMTFFITPALNAMGQALGAVGNFIGILFEPIGRMIQAFGKWADASRLLGNLFSWMGDMLHGFLQYLGVFQSGPTSARGVNPNTIPKSTYKVGQVQPSQTIGGTVGMRNTTYIPPIKGAAGGRSAAAPNLGGIHVGAIHIHDAGSKNPQQLAKDVVDHLPAEAWTKITAHVNAHNAAQAQHDHLYGSIDPVGLTPGNFGY